MKVELNIGLKTNDGGSLALKEVENTLQTTNGVRHLKVRKAVSSTEETAVCEFEWVGSGADLVFTVYELSCVLRQDCIAVFYPHLDNGVLVGPKAREWGAFDIDQFIRY